VGPTSTSPGFRQNPGIIGTSAAQPVLRLPFRGARFSRCRTPSTGIAPLATSPCANASTVRPAQELSGN
jgi:hypothetical protein